VPYTAFPCLSHYSFRALMLIEAGKGSIRHLRSKPIFIPNHHHKKAPSLSCWTVNNHLLSLSPSSPLFLFCNHFPFNIGNDNFFSKQNNLNSSKGLQRLRKVIGIIIKCHALVDMYYSFLLSSYCDTVKCC